MSRAHDPKTLDDVGEIDDHAAHVEDQARAIEKEIAFRRLVELEQEAEEAGRDDDVQDAGDQGRGGM